MGERGTQPLSSRNPRREQEFKDSPFPLSLSFSSSFLLLLSPFQWLMYYCFSPSLSFFRNIILLPHFSSSPPPFSFLVSNLFHFSRKEVLLISISFSFLVFSTLFHCTTLIFVFLFYISYCFPQTSSYAPTDLVLPS